MKALRYRPDRVRIARDRAGYTRPELAAILGCHERAVESWERKRLTRTPRLSMLNTLARALGVEPIWLLNG